MSLDRATIWPYDERGEHGDFFYQRYAHPTGVAAEQALGELDGGHALLFPSGAGATTALALSVLQPGSTVALAAGVYFGTGRLLAALEPWGVDVVEFDQTGPPPEGADLVWLEAPSNPFLTMPDLEAAAAHPATVVVDATVATPVHLRPLEHGADFVLHSATKYLAGHDDVLLGVVVAKDDELRPGSGNCEGRSGSSPRRTRAGCCSAASKRSRSGWSGKPRRHESWQRGSARIEPSRSSAIPASEGSFPSTWPTATQHAVSRPQPR